MSVIYIYVLNMSHFFLSSTTNNSEYVQIKWTDMDFPDDILNQLDIDKVQCAKSKNFRPESYFL